MKQLSSFILLFFLIVTISFQSCNSKKKNDEEIILDIFPQIVDSLAIKHIKSPPPPPPPNDSLKIYPELIKWRQRMDSIESQKKMIILIEDTLDTIESDNFKIEKILKNKTYSSIKASLNKYKKPRKIDLKRMNIYDNYEFLYFSNHIKPGLQLFDIENKKFGGLLNFSQVYLNESKNNGILKLSYTMAHGFGEGYIITIKKVKNEWRITKFHFDWIS